MKIIAFEGLGAGPWLMSSYLREGLLSKFSPSQPVDVWSWFGPKPPAPTDLVVVIGHSFGGNAALNWANQYPNNIAGLVTIDPRSMTSDFTGGNFINKANSRAYNFFQKGLLPGYWVSSYGKNQVTNLQLYGTPHWAMPSRDEVLEAVKFFVPKCCG